MRKVVYMMILKTLTLLIIAASVTIASDNDQNSSKKNIRIQKAVQKAMEKEKKYAKEQRFYSADEYDFKGAEIDPNTLDNIETIEPDYDYTNDWGACDNN